MVDKNRSGYSWFSIAAAGGIMAAGATMAIKGNLLDETRAILNPSSLKNVSEEALKGMLNNPDKLREASFVMNNIMTTRQMEFEKSISVGAKSFERKMASFKSPGSQKRFSKQVKKLYGMAEKDSSLMGALSDINRKYGMVEDSLEKSLIKNFQDLATRSHPDAAKMWRSINNLSNTIGSNKYKFAAGPTKSERPSIMALVTGRDSVTENLTSRGLNADLAGKVGNLKGAEIVKIGANDKYQYLKMDLKGDAPLLVPIPEKFEAAGYLTEHVTGPGYIVPQVLRQKGDALEAISGGQFLLEKVVEHERAGTIGDFFSLQNEVMRYDTSRIGLSEELSNARFGFHEKRVSSMAILEDLLDESIAFRKPDRVASLMSMAANQGYGVMEGTQGSGLFKMFDPIKDAAGNIVGYNSTGVGSVEMRMAENVNQELLESFYNQMGSLHKDQLLAARHLSKRMTFIKPTEAALKAGKAIADESAGGITRYMFNVGTIATPELAQLRDVAVGLLELRPNLTMAGKVDRYKEIASGLVREFTNKTYNYSSVLGRNVNQSAINKLLTSARVIGGGSEVDAGRIEALLRSFNQGPNAKGHVRRGNLSSFRAWGRINPGEALIDEAVFRRDVESIYSFKHVGKTRLLQSGNEPIKFWDGTSTEFTKYRPGQLIGMVDGQQVRAPKDAQYVALRKAKNPNLRGDLLPGDLHDIEMVLIRKAKDMRRGDGLVLAGGSSRQVVMLQRLKRMLNQARGVFGTLGGNRQAAAMKALADSKIDVLFPELDVEDISMEAFKGLKTVDSSAIARTGKMPFGFWNQTGTRTGTTVRPMADHFTMLQDMGMGETANALYRRVGKFDKKKAELAALMTKSWQVDEDVMGARIPTEVKNVDHINDLMSKPGVTDIKTTGYKYQSVLDGEIGVAIQQMTNDVVNLPSRPGFFYFPSEAVETIAAKPTNKLSAGYATMLTDLERSVKDIIYQEGNIKSLVESNAPADKIREAVLKYKEALGRYKSSSAAAVKGKFAPTRRFSPAFKNSSRLSVRSTEIASENLVGVVGKDALETLGIKWGRFENVEEANKWSMGREGTEIRFKRTGTLKERGDISHIDSEGRIHLWARDKKGKIIDGETTRAQIVMSRQPNTGIALADLRYDKDIRGRNIRMSTHFDQMLMMDRDNDVIDTILMRAYDGQNKAVVRDFDMSLLKQQFNIQKQFIDRMSDMPGFKGILAMNAEQEALYAEGISNLSYADRLSKHLDVDSLAVTDQKMLEEIRQNTKFKSLAAEGLSEEKQIGRFLATQEGSAYRQRITNSLLSENEIAINKANRLYNALEGKGGMSRGAQLGSMDEAAVKDLIAKAAEGDAKTAQKLMKYYSDTQDIFDMISTLRGAYTDGPELAKAMKTAVMIKRMGTIGGKKIIGPTLIPKATNTKRLMNLMAQYGGLGTSVKGGFQMSALGATFQQFPIFGLKHADISYAQDFMAQQDAIYSALKGADVEGMWKKMSELKYFEEMAGKYNKLHGTKHNSLEFLDEAFGEVKAALSRSAEMFSKDGEAGVSQSTWGKIFGTFEDVIKKKSSPMSLDDFVKFAKGTGIHIPEYAIRAGEESGSLLARAGKAVKNAGSHTGIAGGILGAVGALALLGAMSSPSNESPLIGKSAREEEMLERAENSTPRADTYSVGQDNAMFDNIGFKNMAGQSVNGRGSIGHGQDPSMLGAQLQSKFPNSRVNVNTYGNNDSRLSIRTRKRMREQ